MIDYPSKLSTELSTATDLPHIEGPTLQPIRMEDNSEIKTCQTQLYVAAKNALELHKMLKFVGANIEGWCQAKITMAANSLEEVKNYIEYEMVSSTLAESESFEEEYLEPHDDEDVEPVSSNKHTVELEKRWVKYLTNKVNAPMGRGTASAIAKDMAQQGINPPR